MRKTPVRSAVMTAFLAASAFSTVAFAVYEAEPNDSFNSPQRLVIGSDGRAQVTGSIGDPSGTSLVNDTDFYTFEGTRGDEITINIDGGIKGGRGGRDVNTSLTLFRPNSTVIRANTDGNPRDSGSLSILDARIDKVKLPQTGTYTIAVTAETMAFMDGGILIPGTRAISNGSYTLIISGATPSVQQINIEIKPGSGERAPINLKSRGSIPVALLGSPEFDALKVNVTSLTFGPTGTEAKMPRCGKEGEDVDGDGQLDLVCHFDNQAAGFEQGDLEGIVMGRTAAGGLFEGRGILKVLPSKRQ